VIAEAEGEDDGQAHAAFPAAASSALPSKCFATAIRTAPYSLPKLTSAHCFSSSAKAEWRCLVPATSFCEWTDSWPKVTHWFALNESRSLFAFAGMWRLWIGERKGEAGEHKLSAFLTTESNKTVRPIHAKAMPVLLTTTEECGPRKGRRRVHQWRSARRQAREAESEGGIKARKRPGKLGLRPSPSRTQPRPFLGSQRFANTTAESSSISAISKHRFMEIKNRTMLLLRSGDCRRRG
jgi:SOS response associated peptidase (SRAP)